MACTNYIGTLNNPTEVPHEFLERVFNSLKAKYVCGQLERGAEGTPHIQFFVNGKKPGWRLAALKKVAPTAHWEQVRVNNGADDYCLKSDTRVEGPWEFGSKPVKRNSSKDWQRVRDQAIAGEFQSIDPEVLVKHYSALRSIHKDLAPKAESSRQEPR